MQIEMELRKMQNAITVMNKKIDSISEIVDYLQEDLENTEYGLQFDIEGIQTKLDLFLGYPLSHIGGLSRKTMQKCEPDMYKRILEAEKAAGILPWNQEIELEDYIKMLENGYGTRKSANAHDYIKEPSLTPVESIEKKAMIRSALTTFKTIKEISAETGIPERTAYRILHAMLEAGEIRSDNGRPEKFVVVNPSPDTFI